MPGLPAALAITGAEQRAATVILCFVARAMSAQQPSHLPPSTCSRQGCGDCRRLWQPHPRAHWAGGCHGACSCGPHPCRRRIAGGCAGELSWPAIQGLPGCAWWGDGCGAGAVRSTSSWKVWVRQIGWPQAHRGRSFISPSLKQALSCWKTHTCYCKGCTVCCCKPDVPSVRELPACARALLNLHLAR